MSLGAGSTAAAICCAALGGSCARATVAASVAPLNIRIRRPVVMVILPAEFYQYGGARQAKRVGQCQPVRNSRDCEGQGCEGQGTARDESGSSARRLRGDEILAWVDGGSSG